jgi:thiol-disulfide isomerase/thioredoxin
MTRRPVHPISRLLAITATAVASGIVLLVLARTYGPEQFALSQSAVPEPVGTPPSESSVVSANPLELAVFDQPRVVPETHFADEEGHDVTLADFRGRVVLLNIWATWCAPCRKEMPTLDRLQAKLGGTDFLVVPLSIDREKVAAVKRFYQDLGLEKLAIYVDQSGKGSRALAVPGVPTTLLINQEGREVARKMGPAEWDGPDMVSLIERTIHARSASDANPDR